jgi:MFS family permease
MSPLTSNKASTIIETDIPARLDRLPWGRFHTTIVLGLGVTWILDGLEVTLVGAIGGALKQDRLLALSDFEVGLAGSAYLAGAVMGALLFGWLTDIYGRKKLFFVTLGVYLCATAMSGLAWNFASFAFFRALVGAGIGGEYAAINSAIQEFMPARLRGQVDLIVNGSFWIGASIGALGALFLLDPAFVSPSHGWRAAFLIGAVLGLPIFLLRFAIPESPRWLVLHKRSREAEEVMEKIERVAAEPGQKTGDLPMLRLTGHAHTPLREMIATLIKVYPTRTFVGVTLIAAQAFLYNAVFFTYALTLANFYKESPKGASLHLLALAASNFLGPLALGRLFDTIGRKPMISATYAIAGVLSLGVGLMFVFGRLTAEQQTAGWMLTFFFASPAASSAYLTVGEIFPLEMRAMAIAIFYAFGTALGGFLGPALFGWLNSSGERLPLLLGYALGAALMIGAGAVEWFLGVAAEGKPLETIASPLSRAD